MNCLSRLTILNFLNSSPSVAILFLLFPIALHAQHSKPDTVTAVFINNKINFDGNLTDSAWSKAPKIKAFTQRDLNFGEPCTEKTEVTIVYTPLALYIGIWAYPQDPHSIIAKFLQRDFDFDSDDNFKIIISPFNDKRNGYEFVINALGGRRHACLQRGRCQH